MRYFLIITFFIINNLAAILVVSDTFDNARLANTLEDLWQTAQTITAVDQSERNVQSDSQSALIALANRTKDIDTFIRASKIEAVRSHLNQYVELHTKTASDLSKKLHQFEAQWNDLQTRATAYQQNLKNQTNALKTLEQKTALPADKSTINIITSLQTQGDPLFKDFDQYIHTLADIITQIYTSQADSLQLYWQAISNAKTPARSDDPIIVDASQRLQSELRQLQNSAPAHRANFERLTNRLRRLASNKGPNAIKMIDTLQTSTSATRAMQAFESVINLCVVGGTCPVAQSRSIPLKDIFDDIQRYLETAIVLNFDRVIKNVDTLARARLSNPPPSKNAPKDLTSVRNLCQQFNRQLTGIIMTIRRFAKGIRTVKKFDSTELKQLGTEFMRAHRELKRTDAWVKSEPYAQLLRNLYDISMPLNLRYQGHFFNLPDMQALSQTTKEAIMQALDVFEKDVAPLVLKAPFKV